MTAIRQDTEALLGNLSLAQNAARRLERQCEVLERENARLREEVASLKRPRVVDQGKDPREIAEAIIHIIESQTVPRLTEAIRKG